MIGLRRGVLGVVLMLSCMLTGPVSAQAQDTDAERIARLRDQAAAQADRVGSAPEQQAAKENIATSLAQSVPATVTGETADQSEADSAGEAEADTTYAGNDGLLLGQGEGDLGFGAAGRSSSSGGLGDGWLLSTLAALGVVIALVFALRWVLRRGGFVTTNTPRGSVVEVLSRTSVAPRSHVVLMRVGQRILVLNDSPTGMRTLASIDDPEEMADLLGAVESTRPTSVTKSFNGVMSKLSGSWSEQEAELDEVDAGESVEDGVALVQTRGAVSSVRGRLAALAGGGIKA